MHSRSTLFSALDDGISEHELARLVKDCPHLVHAKDRFGVTNTRARAAHNPYIETQAHARPHTHARAHARTRTHDARTHTHARTHQGAPRYIA